MRRVRLRIHGRVQGVSYRAYTIRRATTLGLAGWVRNRLDGTVEAEAEGEEEAIAGLIAWCHEGPRLAHVDEVTVEQLSLEGTTTMFELRPTR
ncbi:MAG: acylphosphatase [Phycisphaerales bacterium]|nr:acylphosphatase [Phycisphaerales bacterium]